MTFVVDHSDKRINVVELTIMDHYEAAEEWCNIFAPDLVTKIVQHRVEEVSKKLKKKKA